MARYNPESSRDIKKLRDAMDYSTKKFTSFQERYVELWRHYAADNGSEESIGRMLPMNMVRMQIDILSRLLAAKAPSIMVSTASAGLRPQAYEQKLAVDHLLREIQYGKTLRSVVRSALVMMGIMKVGLTDAPMGESLSIYHDVGQPFADSVLFGDWLHDMNARSTEEWEFCGNRYRVPLDDVKGNPLFKNTDRLSATNLDRFVDGGDYSDEETRVETITQGTSTLQSQEYIDHIELWDIWLPRENLLITLAADGEDEPLLVTEWTGPERGPFHILCFGEIPGNVIPTGVVGNIFDIHDLLNRMFVKLGDQGERQKTVGVASQAATSDGTADTVLNLDDGEIFSSAHPDAIKEMRFGGVDQQNLAFTGWLRGIASYIGGNLDTLGGLQSGADTLGQEKLLQQQSSGLVDDLYGTVDQFSKGAITDLSWWQYTEDDLSLPLRKEAGRFSQDFMWDKSHREADFFEFNFDVVPFSSKPQTPASKLQFLSNFVRQEVIPMAQTGMLQASGVQFDAQGYIRTLAQLSDIPEINSFLKVNGQSMQISPPGMNSVGGMPAHTTREYTRKSETSNQGQAGMDQAVMQGAAGASMPQGTGPSMMPAAQ